MTEKPRAKGAKRILIAINSAPGSLAPMGLAIALAARLKARLDALVVEDAGLYDLAELPFSQELNAESGVLAPLDPHKTRRASIAQSNRVNQLLSDASKRLNLDAKMNVVRGRYLNEAMESGHRADAVIISTKAAITRKTYTIENLLPHGLRALSPNSAVYVLFSETESGTRAMRLGADIAMSSRHQLIVVPTSESVSRAQIQIAASKILSDHAGGGPIVRVKFHYEVPNNNGGTQQASYGQKGRSLKEITAQDHCELLVVGRDYFADQEIAREQIDQLRCPVLIVF